MADGRRKAYHRWFCQTLLKLSPDMQDVVKQTLMAAYRFDKKRGALQNIEESSIEEIAVQTEEETNWIKIEEDGQMRHQLRQKSRQKVRHS